MPYLLRRTRDGAGDSGLMSLAQIPTYDQDTGKIVDVEEKHNARPQVGASMRVGSPYGRTFLAQDWWQTTMITEILVNYMSPSFEQWRRFRLESLVAARHSTPIAKQLSVYAAQTRRTFTTAAAHAPSSAAIRLDTGLSARAGVLGLSIFEMVDPTIRQLDWRWIPVK